MLAVRVKVIGKTSQITWYEEETSKTPKLKTVGPKIGSCIFVIVYLLKTEQKKKTGLNWFLYSPYRPII